MSMSARMILGIVLGLLALAGPAWAAGGGCVPDGSCSAAAPSCAEQVTVGSDNCGNTCYQWFYNPCTASEPSCAEPVTFGQHVCGETCSRGYDIWCMAETPACEQTTTGVTNCGEGCSRTGGSCDVVPESWVPYGYAQPGHATYGFGLPSNNTKPLLGLTAKGNIVLGDYTSPSFHDYVVPLFDGSEGAVTMPYVIDPTDASLGYHDAGFDDTGKPKFSGNYDQFDGGVKLNADGTVYENDGGSTVPRKFYESSLTDEAFQALVDANWDPETAGGWQGGVNAVLFTNHALMGYTPQEGLNIFGSVVARDDTLVYNTSLGIEHDARLTTGGANQATDIGLPFSIRRPTLCGRIVCPASGCSDDMPACP
jgi:hypothetical protein